MPTGLITVLLVLGLSLALGASAAEGWTPRPLGTTEAPYGYLEHLPPGIEDAGTKRFPLVFFMHGLGELGDGTSQLAAVAKHGPFKHLGKGDAIAGLLDEAGCIVIGPQGLKADKWWKTDKLSATLDHVLATYPVDPARIYITGLSMGGGGTWALGTARAEVVAALVPVCGAGKPKDPKALRGVPVWAFHALGDQTVPFGPHTEAFIDALLADAKVAPAGGIMASHPGGDQIQTGSISRQGWSWASSADVPSAKTPIAVTVYPDGSHDSWSRTYRSEAMWAWLLAQSKR